jgi:catechol-2,3-dioxygenase
MTSPTKLAHVVLWTRRVQEMRDWYLKVLDGRVVHESPRGAFITYDEEHHRIAVVDPEASARAARELVGSSEGLIGAGGTPAPVPVGSEPAVAPPLRGLAHVAFTFSALEDLLSNWKRLKADSITPTACINHGPTTSMYYADPDGNQIELQIDNFETLDEGMAFMQSPSFAVNPVGIVFDPDDMLTRLRGGSKAADLVRPTW